MAKIAEGDILFSRGKSASHRTLAALSNGISHVALVYRDDDGELYVSSMSHSKACCMKHSVLSYTCNPFWEYILCVRVTPELDETQLAVLRTWCKKDWKYSWFPDTNHMYCTHHVNAFLKQIGASTVERVLLPGFLLEHVRYSVVFAKGRPMRKEITFSLVVLAALVYSKIRTTLKRRRLGQSLKKEM